MKKDILTYKIINLLLLIGMIVHLFVAHPFAEGWIMCNVDANAHLENVNLSKDCHSPHENSNLVFSSNCQSDIILEHQDEFYSNFKNSQKRILPVSLMIYTPDIENNILYSYYSSINLLEIEPLPLTLKSTVYLLI